MLAGSILSSPERGEPPGASTLHEKGDLDHTLVATGGTGGINGGIMKLKRGPWGVGQYSLFEDPDGRMLGMWKQQR